MKFLILLMPLFLFGSFQENPYLKENQINELNKIKETDYRNDINKIKTLQEIFLFTKDNLIEEEVLNLYNNFDSEIKIVDKKDVKKIRKVKPEVSLKKFNNLKNRTHNTYRYFLFSEKLKIDNKDIEERINKRSKVLSPDEVFYQLKYFIFHKSVQEAKDSFLTYINRNFEKKFEMNLDIRETPSFAFNGDIYALGAFLNLDNSELFEEYKKKAAFFHKDKDRFNYVLASVLEEKELYVEATHFYESIKNESKDHLNKLIEIYKLAAQKAQLNNKLEVSWVNARKGLLLNKNYRDKKLDINNLLELKNILKEVSGPYIDSLVNKREIKHSRDVRKETIDLLLISVI